MTLKDRLYAQNELIDKLKAINNLYAENNSVWIIKYLMEFVQKFGVCYKCGINATEHIVEPNKYNLYEYRQPQFNELCFSAKIDVTKYM